MFRLLTVALLVLCATAQESSGQAEAPTYIPATLAEALDSLDAQLSPSKRAYIRDSIPDEMSLLHMSMGLGIRNSWGLWNNSRLAQYFQTLGVFHPDDMSSIILTSLWRRLNGRPLDVEGQVAQAQRYWQYATPPKSTVIPECPAGVQILGWEMSHVDGFVAATHVGQCPTTRAWWLYRSDRGWTAADSSDFRDWLSDGRVIK